MRPPAKKKKIVLLDEGKIVLPQDLIPAGVSHFVCEQSEEGYITLIPLDIQGTSPLKVPSFKSSKSEEVSIAKVIDFRTSPAFKRKRRASLSRDAGLLRDEGFVELQHFSSRLEAEMLGEILKQSEMPYLIQSEDIGVFGPGASPSPGGARLVVRTYDLEEARSLLLGLIDMP